ncbi:SseB family protein [Agathobacter ruminis]|uniref:Uncharacterized protein n=1 Tax=Agathobacter ruminis TaxID=1712665 RepID=A0A2G3E2X3_9FIRM|nr:SseB family protein [Agathobacter ruminis]MDC7300397.1 SseB family protein [Agathobacter ruminis]PHU37505.1 hypothetical protein CSX02_07580 [Agathobacter ruminis]
MGQIIAREDRFSSPRRDAELALKPSGKRICNEKRYLEELKKGARHFRKLTSDAAREYMLPLLLRGLMQDFNIHMSARNGRFDDEVEIEMIPGSDGKFYFAIYTDALAAYRSTKAHYYNSDYVISLDYLFSAVCRDENCGGICINPFDDGGCMVTRFRIAQMYQQKSNWQRTMAI